MFPRSLQITNQSPMCQLQSARRLIPAPTVVNRLCSWPTKCYGSGTNYIAHLSIHTKYVPTDIVFAMTLGILTDPLGLT